MINRPPNLPLNILRSDKDPGGSAELDPGVRQDHFGRKTLTGILDQELGNEVFGLIGDVSPVLDRKVKVTILDGVEEELLAGVTGFTLVPTALSSAVAREGRVAAEQDVHDDAKGPEITPLVIGEVTLRVIHEGLDDLWSHELSRTDLEKRRE